MTIKNFAENQVGNKDRQDQESGRNTGAGREKERKPSQGNQSDIKESEE